MIQTQMARKVVMLHVPETQLAGTVLEEVQLPSQIVALYAGTEEKSELSFVTIAIPLTLMNAIQLVQEVSMAGHAPEETSITPLLAMKFVGTVEK